MTFLILGLVLFLGVHSVHLFAPDFRQQMIDKLGEGPWKGIYTLISLVGFVLLIWGYGQARATPEWIWIAPGWTRHLSALLMIPSFILLTAAYVPGSLMKAKLGHPMVLGTKTWAFAHLISNGTLADILLFGGFLVWAIFYYAITRRRERREGVTRTAVGASRDAIAVVVGLVFYVVFALFLHGWLIGVRPFG